MTREILYRGKRVDNGEWVYGAFCPDVLEIKGKEVDWGFIRTFNETTEKMEMIEVDRKTVGQYTNIDDKNGNKIFEGNIVKLTSELAVDDFDNFIGEVKFECGSFNIVNNYHGDSVFQDCRDIEVIGNICDNKELLVIEK